MLTDLMDSSSLCAKVSHIEGRLAYIKAELKITEAQEPLWNSYTATASSNSTNILKRCNAMLSKRLVSKRTRRTCSTNMTNSWQFASRRCAQ